MSVFWKGEIPLGRNGTEYGCDGDYVHGHIKVNYWVDREEFIAEVDRRLAEVRDAMIAEATHMRGEDWSTDGGER
jgi:hypothetical protein